MKQRFRLFLRRGSIYYAFDNETKRFQSLKTGDKAEANRLVVAMNDASRQPVMNLSLARIYLRYADPKVSSRTWRDVIDEIINTKAGEIRHRWTTVKKDKALLPLLDRTVISTQAEDFLKALREGTVSTNVYLRRMQNFALDMNWMPNCVIPKRQWPAVKYKEKRAITLEEHQKVIAAETNPERKVFYQLCWHLGASQGDIANLKGEDVDWENGTISFFRKKTGVPVVLHLGAAALNLLGDLSSTGLLFPYLSQVRSGDRATEFAQRCHRLDIHGVTLHSYRYAWAERAKVVGYPERFAQQALGHNSKAVHRAYARRALVKVPSLDDYEAKHQASSTSAQ